MANYIDNKELHLELEKSNEIGELTPKCVKMFLLMVDRIQMKYRYVDIDDKFDCRSAAIEVVLNKWKTFKLDRDNPFAYFTRMIANGLHAGWNELAKKRVEFSTSNVFNEDI